VESALDGEITDHLGYDKHDPAGKYGGNSRNGTRAKTVLTEVGTVPIDVPRHRDGSFEPQIVRNASGGSPEWRTWCCRFRQRVDHRGD
jgi:putative transposase